MKILIADDDAHTRNGLKEALESEGYEVAVARDGKEALEQFEKEKPSLLLLDVMMPHVSGYEVCRTLRQKNCDTPILFLSAKGEEVDKVVGLELGADDYVTKPFGLNELKARVRVIARRQLPKLPNVETAFSIQEITIHPTQLRAEKSGTSVELSMKEIKVLRLLVQKSGTVVSREELFSHAWGMHYLQTSRALDQAIAQLRKKLVSIGADEDVIRTVHGAGFRVVGRSVK